MKKTKVLIVDDHHVVVEGISSALKDNAEFQVVGAAYNGREAIEKTNSLMPDIIIMDVSMPQMNGIEATRKIKEDHSHISIVIYTMHSDKQFVIDLFKSGISAYVLKDDPLSDLLLALRAVNSGGTYFSTMAPSILLRHMENLEEGSEQDDGLQSLSRREKEVFKLLAEGLSIKEIAKKLCISPKTVESHKYHIMEKVRAESIVDLTKLAIKKNLIKL